MTGMILHAEHDYWKLEKKVQSGVVFPSVTILSPEWDVLEIPSFSFSDPLQKKPQQLQN